MRSWSLIRGDGITHDDPEPSNAAISIDPDDEYLIDLARAAGVDAIVSGDTRLLDLRHLLPVVTPAEFLATLGDP